MRGSRNATIDKTTLFRETPIPKALYAMAVPTIISQLVNLIHNMVDAFFIGRTGNAYMMAATSITLTLVLMNVALANLFCTGGGSLMARLMGAGRPEREGLRRRDRRHLRRDRSRNRIGRSGRTAGFASRHNRRSGLPGRGLRRYLRLRGLRGAGRI